jgi:cation diffusion facilitator CzcD-associated flavoprotein CzcO
VTFICKHFVLATGFAAKRYIPNFKGLDKFKGLCTHTATWPQGGVDLKGKRVGVIGTGASGVQTIQEIAPDVAQLTVFQRTPNLALPMQQQKLDAATQNRNKSSYPDIFKLRRETFGGFHYDFIQRDTESDSPEKRKALYDQLYKNGGFHFWLGAYKDLLFSKSANNIAYNYWRDATRARINDPKVAAQLAPTDAPHAFGTKRPCLEQRYYEVYNQPNVELVPLKENPIIEVTETGIRTKDRFYELDIIVLATGFDSVTGGLTQIDIHGKDGRTMKDRWAQGVYTYLGLATSGFPNLFYMYGPQGPTAFCNGPTCVEIQGDWIVDTVDYMLKNKHKSIEPTTEAEIEFKKHVDDLCNVTLFPETDSWYMGANIPGKVRESLNYAGGVPLYIKEIEECAKSGYKGFAIA